MSRPAPKLVHVGEGIFEGRALRGKEFGAGFGDEKVVFET
jgi:hypothetical protein